MTAISTGRQYLLAATQLFFIALVLVCGSVKPGACCRTDDTACASSSQLRTLRSSNSSAGQVPGQRRKLPGLPRAEPAGRESQPSVEGPAPPYQMPAIPTPQYQMPDIPSAFHVPEFHPLAGTTAPYRPAAPDEGTPAPYEDNAPKPEKENHGDEWNKSMSEFGDALGKLVCNLTHCNKDNPTASGGWITNLTDSSGTQRSTSSVTAALPMRLAGLLVFVVVIAM